MSQDENEQSYVEYDFDITDILKPYQNIIEVAKLKQYDKKKEKDNCRYKSITIPMMSILTVINLAERKAKEKELTFIGLSSNDIELIINKIWKDVKNVQNYLLRLSRLKFVESVYFSKGKTNEIYYRLNKDRFICYKGVYVINYKGDIDVFRIGMCPYSIVCFCDAKSCVLFSKLKEQLNTMFNIPYNVLNESKFFKHYENQLLKWIEDDEKLLNYQKSLTETFDNYDIPEKYLNNLFNCEIIYYYHKINDILKSDDLDINKKLNINVILQSINKNIKLDEDFDEFKQQLDEKYKNLNPNDISYHIINNEKDLISIDGISNQGVNVMQVINHIRRDATMKEQKFMGSSIYRIEMILEQLPPNQDKIKDTIYKLMRLNYIKDFSYKPKLRKFKFHYYDLNVRFPCHQGICILFYPTNDLHNFFLFNCPNHLKCDLTSKSCCLNNILFNMISEMIYPYKLTNSKPNNEFEILIKDDVFVYIHSMMKEWVKEEENMMKYYNNLESLLKNERVFNQPVITQLNDSELIYYGKVLENITNDKEKNELKYDIISLIKNDKTKIEIKNDAIDKKSGKQYIDLQKEIKDLFIKLIMSTPIPKN